HLINPGQTGVTGKKEIMLSVRSSLASGLENPEKTQFLSYSMPLKKNLSLGVSVANTTYNIVREIDFYLDGSYKLKVDETKNLFFGLKIGGTTLNIDRLSLGQDDDPLLDENVNRPFDVNMGAGVYFQAKNYYVGVSIPKFIKMKRYNSSENNLKAVTQKQLYMNLGYDFNISSKSTKMFLKPSLMMVHDFENSTDFEVALAYELMEKFELAVANRFNHGFGALAMFKFLNNFKIGYSYSTITSGLQMSNHELVLRASF
ncbi:MAG: hypothetical protein CR961_00875, partial [Polaribacter sp.]